MRRGCKEETLAARFFDNKFLKSENGCWEWKAVRRGNYGQIGYGNTMIYAHRASWIIHNKQNIPEDLCVCHKCDNPICVNPDHLFLGTSIENTIDRITKGRTAKHEKHSQSKLSELDVLKIKQMLNEGISQGTIAFNFKVCRQTISLIKLNKIWKPIAADKFKEEQSASN